MIVNCVGYIHDMELCIKDLLDANKSFKMILGAYGKDSPLCHSVENKRHVL